MLEQAFHRKTKTKEWCLLNVKPFTVPMADFYCLYLRVFALGHDRCLNCWQAKLALGCVSTSRHRWDQCEHWGQNFARTSKNKGVCSFSFCFFSASDSNNFWSWSINIKGASFYMSFLNLDCHFKIFWHLYQRSLVIFSPLFNCNFATSLIEFLKVIQHLQLSLNLPANKERVSF